MPTTSPVAAQRCTQATRSPRCCSGQRRGDDRPPSRRVRGRGRQPPPHLVVADAANSPSTWDSVQPSVARDPRGCQPTCSAVQRHRAGHGRAGASAQVAGQRRGRPRRPARVRPAVSRSGSTPAQCGRVRSSGSSSRPRRCGPGPTPRQRQRQHGGLGQLAVGRRTGVGGRGPRRPSRPAR